MSDRVTYRQMAALKKEIAAEEINFAEWASTLGQLDELIASGEADDEITALKPGAEQDLKNSTQKLEQLRRELAELEATLPQSAAPTVPKFDPEKHPLLKKVTEKLEPAKPVVFSSGSVCEAQWVDRAWYKATVLTVLGSASDPKYLVRFTEYEETATVDRNAIRPVFNEKKRKAEPVPAPLPAPSATNSPYVISGPASINPSAVAAKKEPVSETAVPTNRRVIGSRKALERKGTEWKKFLSKGPGKQVAKKDSMFRSGTGVNSRVGFTGSGAGMTATSKRTRYNSKADEEEEARQDERKQPDWRPTARRF
ncbi:hypothetical protein K491DRAFT_703150 [Lophiostoma macrostomum CBS 122681]|uniref:Tudor domain-containing protein n=1 Tax=Lophiostoma macrostomum CBS 122681 TaxID=1314788 RepID=A0A6A6TEM3_9PLEO|nr:hypothetical protein K491DRAFT_703150 [Lophiostoma macrostomum CBS 122681]